MKLLPNFRFRQRWSQVSATEMNNLVEVAHALENLTVPGFDVVHGNGGISIRAQREGERRNRVLDVAVVETGDDEESTPMKVREVVYKDNPPKVGQYSWRGTSRPAYVDVGYEYKDYSQFVWPESDDPTLETTIFKARYRNGLLFIDPPKGDVLIVQQCKITNIGGDFLHCRAWDSDGFIHGPTIFVAKVFELRKTPFDGRTYNGVSYVYSGFVEREATNVETEAVETQIVIPNYVVGGIIYAETPIKGGTDVVVRAIDEVPGIEEEPVVWLEQDAGRAWAVKVS